MAATAPKCQGWSDADLCTLAREVLIASRANECSELTLDGIKATDLICWPHLLGHACRASCTQFHLTPNVCVGAIKAALDAGRCRYGSCPPCKREHLPPTEILASLDRRATPRPSLHFAVVPSTSLLPHLASRSPRPRSLS